MTWVWKLPRSIINLVQLPAHYSAPRQLALRPSAWVLRDARHCLCNPARCCQMLYGTDCWDPIRSLWELPGEFFTRSGVLVPLDPALHAESPCGSDIPSGPLLWLQSRQPQLQEATGNLKSLIRALGLQIKELVLFAGSVPRPTATTSQPCATLSQTLLCFRALQLAWGCPGICAWGPWGQDCLLGALLRSCVCAERPRAFGRARETLGYFSGSPPAPCSQPGAAQLGFVSVPKATSAAGGAERSSPCGATALHFPVATGLG